MMMVPPPAVHPSGVHTQVLGNMLPSSKVGEETVLWKLPLKPSLTNLDFNSWKYFMQIWICFLPTVCNNSAPDVFRNSLFLPRGFGQRIRTADQALPTLTTAVGF